MTSAAALISGMLAAGYMAAGLFFLRFWRQAHDRLFLFFAIAFSLLALQRVLLTLWAQDERSFIVLYALRACAFLIILYGIFDKNRAPE